MSRRGRCVAQRWMAFSVIPEQHRLYLIACDRACACTGVFSARTADRGSTGATRQAYVARLDCSSCRAIPSRRQAPSRHDQHCAVAGRDSTRHADRRRRPVRPFRPRCLRAHRPAMWSGVVALVADRRLSPCVLVLHEPGVRDRARRAAPRISSGRRLAAAAVARAGQSRGRGASRSSPPSRASAATSSRASPARPARSARIWPASPVDQDRRRRGRQHRPGRSEKWILNPAGREARHADAQCRLDRRRGHQIVAYLERSNNG